ncbi:MAG: C25 family cysteine peptidase [Chloroflexi bacterium]|nr:C25 family cysteine peptidase [Chloroflexota bacterium]
MAVAAGSAHANGVRSAVGGVEVRAGDATGLTIEVSAPEFDASDATGPDGTGYVRLAIPGFDSGATSDAPGVPDLPRRSFLLAVPPGAKLGLNVEVLAERSVQLGAAVYPVAAFAADGPVDPATGRVDPSAATGVRDEFARDAGAYASQTLFPGRLAVLEEAGYLRDVRLAWLTVYPLQYTPATGRLRHVQALRVRVTFSGGDEGGGVTSVDVGGFEELLRNTVINPESLAAWRSNPPVPASAPFAFAPGQTRYRITLRNTGIYQLTYGDLQAAGVPVTTLDPRRLRMYAGDTEMAIAVTGEDDGRFDPGDTIRFYATQVNSLYTDTNVVWLVVGDAAGRRMTARSVAPQGGSLATSFSKTTHFEENRYYRSAMPMASDVDHWYWGQTYVLSRNSVLTMTVPFTVENSLPAGTANLRLDLWGASYDPRVNPDHHLRIYVNGTIAGDVYWTGQVQTTPTVTFDQALLQNGGNTLTLYAPGDVGARDATGQPWEVTWLNAFDVTYGRSFQVTGDRLAFTPASGPGEFSLAPWLASDVLLYDVSDPLAPVRLTGAVVGGTSGAYTLTLHDVVSPGGAYSAAGSNALLAPLAITSRQVSDLRAPAAGADYLIISHADFLTGVEALAQLHRSQGLRVRVIDVQDIYDEFSGGLLDFHAIRDFIQYAYFNWPGPAPAYVLLAGNGTYDFMNREGVGAKTFIPPFLANVDPVLGETAADNRFVTVAGDDIMPDLHLGRLPVTSQVELAAMVDKITSYEANPTAGAWRSKTVFVTDNADNAGDFAALSDLAAAYVPPELVVQKIYLGSNDYPSGYAARAQQATLDAFNQGALLFNYVGHSSIGNWAGELLFGLNSLPQVSNGSRYPIMLPMTCLEGSYHNPRFASLSASVVRLSGKGALASWAPTGLGVASGHDYLHRGFYDALFNWDVRQLGPATTAGKLNLFVNGRFSDGTPRFHDLLDTYVLLGDPATNIGVPEAQLGIGATGPTGQLTQGDPVVYAVSFANAGPARAEGVVITATLPAGLTDLAWSSTTPSLTLRAGLPLRWDLPELAPGASGQLTITATVDWGITAASLPFSAEMTVGSRWAESDYSDNRTGPIIATLLPADLRVKQSVQPQHPVAPGEYVTFTLAYVNDGPGAAGGISLTLPIPVFLDDLQVTQSGPVLMLRPGLPYSWAVAPMRAGEAGRVTVSGRVPDSITGQNASWSVAGRIATGWVDPDQSNNQALPGQITVTIPDLFEPDNAPGQAHRVSVPLLPERHRYEFPADQDWTVFQAQAGVTYLIRTLNLSNGGDTVLSLWNGAIGLLAKNDDSFPGSRASQILWTAPATGDYYVMVTAYSASVGFDYDLEIRPLSRTFLPVAPHS